VGKNLAGLRVHLPSAHPASVRELLHAAWRRKAPAPLAAAFDGGRDEPGYR